MAKKKKYVIREIDAEDDADQVEQLVRFIRYSNHDKQVRAKEELLENAAKRLGVTYDEVQVALIRSFFLLVRQEKPHKMLAPSAGQFMAFPDDGLAPIELGHFQDAALGLFGMKLIEVSE